MCRSGGGDRGHDLSGARASRMWPWVPGHLPAPGLLQVSWSSRRGSDSSSIREREPRIDRRNRRSFLIHKNHNAISQHVGVIACAMHGRNK